MSKFSILLVKGCIEISWSRTSFWIRDEEMRLHAHYLNICAIIVDNDTTMWSDFKQSNITFIFSICFCGCLQYGVRMCVCVCVYVCVCVCEGERESERERERERERDVPFHSCILTLELIVQTVHVLHSHLIGLYIPPAQ